MPHQSGRTKHGLAHVDLLNIAANFDVARPISICQMNDLASKLIPLTSYKLRLDSE